MKLSPFIIIFLATISDYCLSQRINSRKDRIQVSLDFVICDMSYFIKTSTVRVMLNELL